MTAPLTLEIEPAIDLQVWTARGLVADQEARAGKLLEGCCHRGFGDLGPQPETEGSDVLGRPRQPALVVGLADDPVQCEGGQKAAFFEKLVSAELWWHTPWSGAVVAGVLVVKTHDWPP